MKIVVIGLVFLISEAFSEPNITDVLDNFGIIGGHDIDIEKAPWQISLQVKRYGTHFCGGSIISPSYIVTAAHCTDGEKAQDLSIRAGSSNRAKEGVTVDVESIHQHPDYNKITVDYDISILKLKTPLVYSAKIKKIELPSLNQDIEIDQDVLITGWGKTKEKARTYPEKLQGVTVKTIANKNCTTFHEPGAITSRMFCAGFKAGGKDACAADSGGPLASGNLLLGVTSWGVGCGRANKPGVYTSVPVLRDFIEEITGI